MKRFMILLLSVVICLAFNLTSYADQVIIAKKVDSVPAIDGKGNDHVWAQAIEYTTYDTVAKIKINLKAVYTDTEIFFLVSYPDPTESKTHKTWTWDKETEMYKTGSDREDTFVFKWNMEAESVDLTLKSDDNYMADLWFWKACRTNPVGYADDKYQYLTSSKIPKSRELVSKSGRKMYLQRIGDKGTPAFAEKIYEDYQGDKMPRFTYKTPTGSLADIKAKGVWAKRRWTIEFGRALKIGNGDDLQFDTARNYSFGVSRYEVAGRESDSKLDQPLYGSGDITEMLTLQFGE